MSGLTIVAKNIQVTVSMEDKSFTWYVLSMGITIACDRVRG
jgi:hypothetical protein